MLELISGVRGIGGRYRPPGGVGGGGGHVSGLGIWVSGWDFRLGCCVCVWGESSMWGYGVLYWCWVVAGVWDMGIGGFDWGLIRNAQLSRIK